MKKYSWIISLLLALSVVVWPVFAISQHIAEVEILYKNSDTISRTVAVCGTAEVSEVPVGESNIGWNEFCGLIDKNFQVSYYLEQGQQEGRDSLEVQAIAKTSTGFVLRTNKEIRASALETITSFGVKDNSIFYTTQQTIGYVAAFWILAFVVFLLVWWFLNWIVSLILGKLGQAIYIRHANAREKKSRAKGSAGIT